MSETSLRPVSVPEPAPASAAPPAATPPPGEVDPAALRIVHHPQPVLRADTAEVDPSDPAVAAVAARMLELMHEADGVGLAAPQVGLSWRLFVTNAGDADPVDRVYVNPTVEIDLRDDEGRRRPNPLEPMEEGCLSLPGVNGVVRRPSIARITATTLEGERVAFEAEDFLARVWQHEFDHLEGILIIDKFGPKDRLANRRAVKALEQGV